MLKRKPAASLPSIGEVPALRTDMEMEQTLPLRLRPRPMPAPSSQGVQMQSSTPRTMPSPLHHGTRRACAAWIDATANFNRG